MDEKALKFISSFKNEIDELECARSRLADNETGSGEANVALEDARRAALKAFAKLEDFLSNPIADQIGRA